MVGNDRFPSYADRESLPYTNALALEVLRWHSVTPTGIALVLHFSALVRLTDIIRCAAPSNGG